MKHVLKNIKNEPQALRDYRNSTPNASYSGYGDKDANGNTPLKTALANEQGYICCYCMQRITEAKMSVEHYITQNHHVTSPLPPQEHKDNDLVFLNMLGSCNTNQRNCSGLRGNVWLTIDPRKIDCERLVRFEKSGRAYSDDPSIQGEIEKILQLNNPVLQKNRRDTIDRASKRLDSYKKKGFLSRSLLENEINYWLEKSEGQYREYCMAAVHYLQSKLKYAQ